MKWHIQETIFPDRHTVAVMHPQTGEFIPVAEIEALAWLPMHSDSSQWHRYKTIDGQITSEAGDTLESFARLVAKFYNPFTKLRPSDYTGNLFE